MFSGIIKGTHTRSQGISNLQRRYSVQVPLTDFIPGFAPKVGDIKIAKNVLQKSALPNGLKVITYSGSGDPVSSVGIYINSGSRFEDAETSGASFFLKHMAFKSNSELSSLRFSRGIEFLGGTYDVTCGREHMSFTSQVLSDKVPVLTELLVKTFTPTLKHWEVRDTIDDVKGASEAVERDPRAITFETLHQEAYRNKGLGQTLYAPTHNVHNIDDVMLKSFVERNYRTNGSAIVVTGGVSHETVVQQIESLISLTASPERNVAPTEYIGGDARISGDFETHLALGFNGFSAGSTDYPVSLILQAILGSGVKVNYGVGSGSVGRLNHNIAEHNKFVQEISAFNFNYTDGGLFGVFAVAERGRVPRTIDAITKELANLVKPVGDAELKRAKVTAQAKLHNIADSRLGLTDFIGVSAVNNVEGLPTDIANKLEQVTAEDVSRVAKKVLSSKPTLVVLGDVEGTPTVDTIRSAFKS